MSQTAVIEALVDTAVAAAWCRHCGPPRRRTRPRGLCWTCFDNKAVRALYPFTACRGSERGVGLENTACRPAAGPTAARPGSEEKVAVMEARAARGESVFHPADPVLRGPAGGDRRPRVHLSARVLARLFGERPF